jgi:iodotyrosine deiodinase
MPKKEFLPLPDYREYPIEEMKQRASEFYTEMKRRRTVRQFSDRPIPRDIIEDCVCTASTSPSGANMQPWSFVIVSDRIVKRQIREAAEKVEREFYESASTQTWVKTLDHLGTDQHKPFLETAPYLIVIFSQLHGFLPDGGKKKHYYVTESVGIATGMLIAAVHHAGLASLTYTPSTMRFLNKILSRPSNEKPFMILVVGYPAEDVHVPVIHKKVLKDVAVFL